MTMPTKAQIDALVEAVQPYPGQGFASVVTLEGYVIDRGVLRRTLYLAAGLNADGSEKAKVMRAVLRDFNSNALITHGTWDGTTFTPDGAP